MLGNGFPSPQRRWPRPDALKPDIHGVRTHWIPGFMAFQVARMAFQLARVPFRAVRGSNGGA